jgi:hypothetical protein
VSDSFLRSHPQQTGLGRARTRASRGKRPSREESKCAWPGYPKACGFGAVEPCSPRAPRQHSITICLNRP